MDVEGRPPLAVSRRPPQNAVSFEWVCGDLLDERFGEDLPPIDRIVSLCPIWLLPAGLPALLSKGARRVVAFSSTSRSTKIASPDPKERGVAQALALGEEETRRLCEQAGAAWTILRPTLIYSEGRDGNVTRIANLIRRLGVVPLAGGGGGLRQPVHAEDLALAVVSVLSSPGAADQAFNLVGGETLTYRTMVERVFKGLGRKPRILSVPPALWATALWLSAPLLPGATQAMGARMSQDLVFDDTAAQQTFGWRPRNFHPKFQTG